MHGVNHYACNTQSISANTWLQFVLFTFNITCSPFNRVSSKTSLLWMGFEKCENCVDRMLSSPCSTSFITKCVACNQIIDECATYFCDMLE